MPLTDGDAWTLFFFLHLAVTSLLAGRIRGQTVKFPAPKNFFAEWPRLVHPRVAELREHVEGHINEYVRYLLFLTCR